MSFFARLVPPKPMHGYNFTERTRKVLADARLEAARLGHDYVGTEHLLLALIADEGGVAAAVFTNLGVDRAGLRGLIDSVVKGGSGRAPHGAELPYTSRAKRVLELSMAEAQRLRHDYIGTEHLLLGLIAEERGIAAQFLAEHRLTLDGARAETVRLLGAPPEPSAPA